MSLTALLTAVLAGAAAGLWTPPSARRRVRRAVVPGPTATSGGAGARSSEAGPGVLVTTAAATSAGLGLALVAGGVIGVVLGAVTAVVAAAVLRRLEPRALRATRERATSDLPVGVDLLAAGLAAGRPPDQVLAVVATAVGGPVATELDLVVARLRLGSDPSGLWQQVGASSGPLAPLGRTMARSLLSGAPMADGLRLLAQDLRTARRVALEGRARSVGVRAAAPLGLCFLPAFVIVGIVPSIAAAISAQSWW